MFNLNSLSKQIGFGYVLILSIFVISLILTLNQLNTIEASNDKIKDVINPTVKSNLVLLNGINHSLAALRGWMLIGNEQEGEQFKRDRKHAWAEEITKSIDELNSFSVHWTNQKNIKYLRSIKFSLKEFETYQNQIESIANSELNRKASTILFNEASPKSKVLMAEVTKIIELEKNRESSVERKKILGILADIRGSFGISIASIRAYILSGDNKYKLEFTQQWKKNSQSFLELSLDKDKLNSTQLLAYTKLSFVRAQFQDLPEKIFKIRGAEDWDQAKYLLKNKAIPLALEIKHTLSEMVDNQYALQNQEYIKAHEQIQYLKWLLIILLIIGSISSVFVGLQLTRRVKKPIDDIIDIIKGMSKGQFNLSFKDSHITEIYHLSESVQLMKDNLLSQNVILESEKSKLEEDDWIKSSLTSILENLPGLVDIQNFSNELLNSIVSKVNGLVGVFYIKLNNNTNASINNYLESDSSRGDVLSLIGSYAYSFDDSKKAKEVCLGEGLIGQCALSQKIMYISDISDDDISISSTFINTKSKHIALLPISFEGEILALLEIGSIEEFSNAHKNLIEQVIKNTGVILKAVLGRIETEKLLNFLNTQNQELNEHTLNLVEAQKLAESANKDLAAQKTAMDQHSLVSVTDIKGIITYANDKFCAVSGYSRDELIGTNHRILNSNNQPKDYWRNMFLKVSKGEYWHDEVCNRAKDGRLYWVDTTIVPLYDNDNKLTGYTSIRTDITHQKEIITSLAEAKKQAEVANESKTDFLANMSHEIRTPINGVIGMTNLLLDTSLNQEQNNFAKTVKNSAESLLTIINDILDFSKVEAGMLDLEPIEFDLELLLHDLGSSIAFRAHEKDLELICPANFMQYHLFIADPGRIRQILNNLVGNAIKFTKQGEVSVHCTVLERTAEETQLLFEVKDTGIGLNEEQQNKLFERFSQADGSTTRNYGGTGLGLSISKQLVELMNGEIGVKSNEGKGSTFWFTLPLTNATNQLPNKTFDNLEDQKILVVDDNLTNRTLLGQLLTNWRVEHALVDSGSQALKVLDKAVTENAPYNIAILDMQMPQMDGLQLGAAIKNNSLLSNTLLVMLTSQGQRGDAKELKKKGFSGYLNKPIIQTVLYNTLLTVTGIKTSENQLITAYSSRELPQFKAKVLVVDDNAINQKVAQGLLKKFGIQADLAANGKEALNTLACLSFDLIFMDCQMPIMDGYEASRQIRNPKSMVLDREVPIIAMTANTMQGDREKCLGAGMNDFISKPVDPMKLQELLQHWLPKCLI